MSKILLAAAAILVLLASCATEQRTVSSDTDYEPIGMLDEQVQGDTAFGRKVAEDETVDVKSAPDVKDTAKYLEFLMKLSASGKHSEAEKKIKAYLADHPNDKRAVFILGVHYMRNKKKELAHYFFRNLEKEASFPWKSLVLNNLGMMAMQDKNRREAMDYFERAVKAEPPSAAAFVNLGSLYLQSRSYAEANKLFTRAAAIDENFEDAHLGLAASLEGMGKFEEAHGVYAEHIGNNPNALSALYNDSIILGNRLKRRDEAAQQLLRYIQRGGKETAKAHEIIQGWR